jgi:FtsH-binding integral membrane protein
MGSMAVTMVPLINIAGMPIVYDALFSTGLTMGGLGLVAYNAPSEQFLQWGGALGMGLAAMIGVGLASMFKPHSPGLYNFWLYGGLLLFSAFVLFDTQKVIYNARLKNRWDPINESLAIYLDALILFQRFLLIFMGNRNGKS